jgi:hypothetical protein
MMLSRLGLILTRPPERVEAAACLIAVERADGRANDDPRRSRLQQDLRYRALNNLGVLASRQGQLAFAVRLPAWRSRGSDCWHVGDQEFRSEPLKSFPIGGGLLFGANSWRVLLGFTPRGQNNGQRDSIDHAVTRPGYIW